MDKKEYQGKLDASGRSFALVVSRFNELLSHQLLAGAFDCLERHDAKAADVYWVAGAYEIPAIARKLAATSKYDGLVALGAVIRGDTPHAEYINAEVARGLAKVYFETGIPVTFGVITADTLDQALERSGSKAGNKGWSAALAAIEMVNLQESINQG